MLKLIKRQRLEAMSALLLGYMVFLQTIVNREVCPKVFPSCKWGNFVNLNSSPCSSILSNGNRLQYYFHLCLCGCGGSFFFRQSWVWPSAFFLLQWRHCLHWHAFWWFATSSGSKYLKHCENFFFLCSILAFSHMRVVLVVSSNNSQYSTTQRISTNPLKKRIKVYRDYIELYS